MVVTTQVECDGGLTGGALKFGDRIIYETFVVIDSAAYLVTFVAAAVITVTPPTLLHAPAIVAAKLPRQLIAHVAQSNFLSMPFLQSTQPLHFRASPM
ncbi:hypothetical protein MTO96_012281 [Rhipicephalus appendiculatus]